MQLSSNSLPLLICLLHKSEIPFTFYNLHNMGRFTTGGKHIQMRNVISLIKTNHENCMLVILVTRGYPGCMHVSYFTISLFCDYFRDSHYQPLPSLSKCLQMYYAAICINFILISVCVQTGKNRCFSSGITRQIVLLENKYYYANLINKE